MQNKEEINLENKSSKEMIAFILSGDVRMKIFVDLASKPSYAYKLAKDIGLHPTSVIRTLNDMKTRNIIECLNPDSYRRKFYQLTRAASKLKDKVLQCVYSQ